MEEQEIVINRPNDIDELVSNIKTPEIKVIIGLRRAGKSYLLKTLFKKYLIEQLKYRKEEIAIRDFDSNEYSSVRNLESFKKMLDLIPANTKILIIDEVQKAGEGYENILIDFALLNKNISIYITGSNSQTLSVDILENFKEHGHRISLRPVPYKEIKAAIPNYSFDDYFKYGSLPIVVKKQQSERNSFLNELYEQTYLSDIKDRCDFKYLSDENMRHIVDNILSNLENPISSNKIYKGIIPTNVRDDNVRALYKKEISEFIDACVSSFLLLNFKDGSIINEKTPPSYRDVNIKKYCFDVGLLNVISTTSFYKKNSCTLENMVYLELISNNIKPEGKVLVTKDESQKSFDFYYIEKGKETYIQVDFDLNDDCYDREIGNLSCVPTGSNKINICNSCSTTKKIPEDIQNINIEKFIS